MLDSLNYFCFTILLAGEGDGVGDAFFGVEGDGVVIGGFFVRQ